MAKKKEQKGHILSIEWNIPDNIITRFATNMTIQTIENEFKISFFEVKPPIVLSEVDQKKMKKIGTVKADCVGRFIVTPDRLPKFIADLNEQLSKYNKIQKRILTLFPPCVSSFSCNFLPLFSR